MPDPIRILQGLILSAAVAAAVVLIFGWPWRAPNQVRIRVGEVLGVGAGIWIGCRLFGVSTNWPLREDQDRLLCIVLPAVILLEFASAALGRRASVVSAFRGWWSPSARHRHCFFTPATSATFQGLVRPNGVSRKRF